MASSTSVETIPELLDGDHISVAEFERRYSASPHIKKAELIEGVVYVAPSVSIIHAEPHSDLALWLGYYRLMTPGSKSMIDGTVRIDMENQPQPDLILRILPEFGGQSSTSDDGFIEGPPELAIEISVSTRSYDLNLKLAVYQRNNVREYIVWQVEHRAVNWFVLRDGQYVPLPLSEEGWFKSEIFPGLWLDPEALFRGNMNTVFDVLQLGLASPEHAAFVAKLRGDARL